MNRFTNIAATPQWGVKFFATGERRTAHSAMATVTAIAASILLSSGDAFAQATPCPPSQPNTYTPSTTTPAKKVPGKTQTAKTEPPTNQSKLQQVKQKHGHSHSRGGLGVGIEANVDLGGIGQRRPEADPFAVPNEPARTAQMKEEQEKPNTKKKGGGVATSDPFLGVQLTGPQAKAERNP